MHPVDLHASLKTHPLSLNRYLKACTRRVRKARTCKAIFTLMCFLAPTISADTVLRASDHFSAVNDFLAWDAVNSRRLEPFGGNSKVRYELRKGEKLENGCRFRRTSSPDHGVSRVEHVIAQDMHRCERLFLIGRPAE